VKAALSAAKRKFRTYAQDFPKGAQDWEILSRAGARGWVVLTLDRRNRHREVELQSIKLHRVRVFNFAANLGEHALAKLLDKVYPEMRKFCRANERPFVAAITKSGNIYLRMDHTGKKVTGV